MIAEILKKYPFIVLDGAFSTARDRLQAASTVMSGS